MGSQCRKNLKCCPCKWHPKCIDAQAQNSKSALKLKTSSTQATPVQTQVDRSCLQRRTDLPQSLNQFHLQRLKAKTKFQRYKEQIQSDNWNRPGLLLRVHGGPCRLCHGVHRLVILRLLFHLVLFHLHLHLNLLLLRLLVLLDYFISPRPSSARHSSSARRSSARRSRLLLLFRVNHLPIMKVLGCFGKPWLKQEYDQNLRMKCDSCIIKIIQDTSAFGLGDRPAAS